MQKVLNDGIAGAGTFFGVELHTIKIILFYGSSISYPVQAGGNGIGTILSKIAVYIIDLAVLRDVPEQFRF